MPLLAERGCLTPKFVVLPRNEFFRRKVK